MGLVIPFCGRESHVMAGRAGRFVVTEGGDVVFAERAAEIDAVARSAELDGLSDSWWQTSQFTL